MNDYIVKMAHVDSVYDDADGLRIKARLAQDGDKSIDKIPYSFPLLPKAFQVVPKKGECVFIISAKEGNVLSNRYYIGPVISQPQMNDYDPYSWGRGSSISLLQGASSSPLAKLSNYEETRGSFPDKNDVAVVGRKSEDVILKDGEIDLRCGIRNKSISDDSNLVGDVIFNRINPAYIQLKYKRGIGHSNGQEADSVINLVADKINLISHKLNANNPRANETLNLTDNEELIKTNEMDSIMSKLHELPYGDVLVEMLEVIRKSITNHVHPYPGMPPCKDFSISNLDGQNFNDILSENIRIN